ncbi:small subunit ribosomal protein S12e [Nematocida sp. LUAm3]|nr:small subunit ribosomal protein S12e [Nematocida sp. LUAm3]KAI5173883.1 small subunit ribosomal protein S12e [Nematocida sp. LUAm2]KAI5177372.1 small subunit ribosomal protein S12e [Nematocida sp. LUAm1]
MDLLHQGEAFTSANEAFKEMCFESIKEGVVIKGLRQVTKSIIGGRSKVVIMSKEIDNKEIKELVEKLAKKYEVPILIAATHQELAEYVRICKFDETGNVLKPARCAVVSIEEFGSSDRAQKFLFESSRSSE